MAKTKVHGEYLQDSVVRFTAKAGENITKGQPVYISGISGELPVVSLADADDTAKMPAFGLAEATVSTNDELEVTSFGTLAGLDTSTPGYSLGDILYVDTTAGALTNDPAGLEATKLQNIGIVQRVHASNGSIKVGGAGRTNAVPNLNDGDIFIGDANNKAVSSSLTTEIESYLDGGASSPVLASLIVDTDTLYVDSANNRVGIGTTSINANAKLHVQGTGDSQILVYETGTSPYTATLKLASQSTTDYGANVQYTSLYEQLTIENFGRSINGTAQGSIRFRTKVGNSSMQEVLHINGYTGNVGIGTSSPYSNLWITGPGIDVATELNTDDVNSNALLTLAGNNALVRLQMGTMDTSPYGVWIQGSYDNNSVGGDDGVEPLALNPIGGNVGIGTSNPSEALHVYDTTESWIKMDSSTANGNSGMRFAHAGTNHGVLYHDGSNDSLRYFDNIAQETRFSINSSGIITTPSQPFFMTNLSAGNQTFANVAWVDLDWSGEPYDIGNNYVLSSGVFTAPVAGVYLFTGLIGFDTITATNYVLARMTCSSAGDFYTTHEQKRDGGGTYGYDHAISQMVYLAASETVKMQVYAGSGGNHTIGNRSNWQGRLLG